jgi:sarcosine oxidase subunit beta
MALSSDGHAVPPSADVVVVGAGVVGAAIAFHLTRLGVREVVTLEKGAVAGRASGRSGALVRTHYTNLDEARVALAALPWFEEWPERVGGDCGFTPTGFLQMVDRRDRPTLRSNVERLRRVGVDTGLVEADEILELAPYVRLADGELAAYEPRSGYADPVATTAGFATAARRMGATVSEGVAVMEVLTAAGQVRGVRTTAGDIASPTVVLANGAWSTSLLRPLGVELDITPIWAQVTFVARPGGLPAGPSGHLTIIDRANGCYLRPQGEDLTLLGLSAFRRPLPDLDADRPEEEPEFAELARLHAGRRIPGLADAHRMRGHGGPLDVTADRRMVLGAAPGVPGLYLAVGMSGGGFKKAPAIGACVAELIVDGKASTAPIEPFRPTRFAEGRPLSGAEYSLPADGVDPGRRIELDEQGLIH